MRCDEESFGALVRPRILVDTYDYEHYSYVSDKKIELEQNTGMPLKSYFAPLSLGNMCTDLEHSYVGEITTLWVKTVSLKAGYNDVKYQHAHTPDELACFKRKYDKIKIVAIGLRFHKGMVRVAGGKVVPNGDLWIPTWKKDWLYNTDNVVPIENIIAYESCKEGDLVYSNKTSGLVVDVKPRIKPKFYLANSLVSKQVVILDTKQGKQVKLPIKQTRIKVMRSINGELTPL